MSVIKTVGSPPDKIAIIPIDSAMTLLFIFEFATVLPRDANLD